jgi:hypothetical protein
MKVVTTGSWLACLYSSSYHNLFLISSFSRSHRVLSLATNNAAAFGGGKLQQHQQLLKNRSASFGRITAARGITDSRVAFLIQSKYPHLLHISRGGDLQKTSTSLFSTTTSSSSSSSSTTTENNHILTSSSTPPVVYRTDYKALDYVVTDVRLSLDIHNGRTTVKSELTILPNPQRVVSPEALLTTEQPPVILDGDETSISLQSISMNGRELIQGTVRKCTAKEIVCLTTTISVSTFLSSLLVSYSLYNTRITL